MVNEVKTVLQIACMAAFLIVLVIAGIVLYRFYDVLGDFRESPIFQPVGSDDLEKLESLVTESVTEQIQSLSPFEGENGAAESVSSLEGLGEIDGLKIPGANEESLEDSPVEGTEAQSDEKGLGETAAEVSEANICLRTPEIQQLLIEMLEIKSCRDITGEELVRIRELELQGIPVKVGDLDGFINLTTLTLVTDEASVGLFDDLASLEYLGLGLKVPPSEGLFHNLASLKELGLFIEAEDDSKELILEGVFDGLAALEHFELGFDDGSYRYAVPLVQGSLTGMPNLQHLEISNVSRLESGTLRTLPALRSVVLQATDLPEHLSKPSLPSDIFVENPNLGSISVSGFRDASRLEFNSHKVVCRMHRNMDMMYGVDFATVVEGKAVEVIDYDWDGNSLDCTLRVAPEGTDNWKEVKVSVPPLPQSRRS